MTMAGSYRSIVSEIQRKAKTVRGHAGLRLGCDLARLPADHEGAVARFDVNVLQRYVRRSAVSGQIHHAQEGS